MANPDAGVPITNTLFPPPPGYYKAFTPAAVKRLAQLDKSVVSGDANGSTAGSPSDAKVEEDVEPAEPGELEKLQAELKPPRADWVREDGRWMLFGQMYTAEPHIPNARDIGLPALVADPVSAGGDSERAALPVLLHSFLHTLVALIDVLTGTARIPGELALTERSSEGDQYIQHLSNLAATMMVSANQLRGVQAEATLVMLMEKQLEERRAQTTRLRAKSREVAGAIRRLKAEATAAGAEHGPESAAVAVALREPTPVKFVRQPTPPAAAEAIADATADDEAMEDEAMDEVLAPVDDGVEAPPIEDATTEEAREAIDVGEPVTGEVEAEAAEVPADVAPFHDPPVDNAGSDTAGDGAAGEVADVVPDDLPADLGGDGGGEDEEDEDEFEEVGGDAPGEAVEAGAGETAAGEVTEVADATEAAETTGVADADGDAMDLS